MKHCQLTKYTGIQPHKGGECLPEGWSYTNIQDSFLKHVACNPIKPTEHHLCTLCKALGNKKDIQSTWIKLLELVLGLSKYPWVEKGFRQNVEDLVETNSNMMPLSFSVKENMILSLKLCSYVHINVFTWRSVKASEWTAQGSGEVTIPGGL